MCSKVFILQGAEGNEKIVQSRGADRDDYILKYLSMTLRKTGGMLKTKESHLETQESKKTTRRMTRYQLVQEFGEEKALYWIPHLTWHPDRITRSTDEEHREYELPDHVLIDGS